MSLSHFRSNVGWFAKSLTINSQINVFYSHCVKKRYPLQLYDMLDDNRKFWYATYSSGQIRWIGFEWLMRFHLRVEKHPPEICEENGLVKLGKKYLITMLRDAEMPGQYSSHRDMHYYGFNTYKPWYVWKRSYQIEHNMGYQLNIRTPLHTTVQAYDSNWKYLFI